MVGILLGLDLKEKGIAVGILHSGFMKAEMTRGVGFDKFWNQGRVVKSLRGFVDGFQISMMGEYWVRRGPRWVDILPTSDYC